ncbi:MAG: OsmC family protein [Anaerolineales bacterium]|uniref:OsmC family protein n=1 Tax=Promineifilum sp. TaxID=2664178 RepID=UPI001D61F63D|nr:OsmC family protein [Anaerolineales bacterium]MCB8934233.1 OsmC family protein [Promineifilum sp.]MCO5179718.1 OsmC family protein [Promineifilum sp.]
MDATLTLQDNLHFTAVPDSGYVVHLDTKAQEGGASAGASPMELLLISLAGCTAMDVVSILRKKRQNLTGFEIRVHGDRATDHPKVFTDFELEYIVHGVNIDPAAVERAIQLSTENYCSAHAMLEKAAHIRTRYTIINE